jgi:choloylglycine hydrolase
MKRNPLFLSVLVAIASPPLAQLIRKSEAFKLQRWVLPSLLIAMSSLSVMAPAAEACTYIRLEAEDGSLFPGRTQEWGAFDLEPTFTIMPRGMAMQSMEMPDGQAGAAWTAKYGFSGINYLGKPIYGDVVNEQGLTAHLLYMPGFADYQPYDPAQATQSISPTDVMTYMVSQYATVAEVRAALDQVRVVPVIEPTLGFPAPVHYVFNDPSGAEMVVEYVGGELQVYTETVSVMTNSPPYDWHLANLRNYVNLRAVAWPELNVAGIDLTPLGEGSGMLGLPGDFTPPSRFVRAVTFRQTARPTQGGFDTVREHFRLLDNFNVPLPVVGDIPNPAGLKPLCCSATQYTVSIDLANQVMYYHTDDDRTVRSIDLKQIDYETLTEPYSQPLRTGELPLIDDVTP